MKNRTFSSKCKKEKNALLKLIIDSDENIVNAIKNHKTIVKTAVRLEKPKKKS